MLWLLTFFAVLLFENEHYEIRRVQKSFVALKQFIEKKTTQISPTGCFYLMCNSCFFLVIETLEKVIFMRKGFFNEVSIHIIYKILVSPSCFHFEIEKVEAKINLDRFN